MSLTDKTLQVYFSPAGGCTEAVLNALESAKSTILKFTGIAQLEL